MYTAKNIQPLQHQTRLSKNILRERERESEFKFSVKPLIGVGYCMISLILFFGFLELID